MNVDPTVDKSTLEKLQRWAKFYLARLKRLNLGLEESGRLAADALATIGMGRGFFPADSFKIMPGFSGMRIEMQIYGKEQEFVMLIT